MLVGLVSNLKDSRKLFVSALIWLLIFVSFAAVLRPASAEDVWIDITLPCKISSSGNYRIASDWSGSGIGLIVAASDVTVDGQGYLIRLSGADGDVGVKLNQAATNVVLENIHVKNADIGLNAFGNNFTVQNCNFNNNEGCGFYAHSCANFTFKGCNFRNNRDGALVRNSENFTFRNTVFSLNDGSGLNSESSTAGNIINCDLNENGRAGFYSISDTDFDIKRSSFNSNGYGIRLAHAHHLTIQTCNMTNNKNTGVDLFSSHRVTIEDSNITNNDVGLNLEDCKKSTITSCLLNNNEFCGMIADSCVDTTIENSIIDNNGVFGVLDEYSQSETIDGNVFSNNGNYESDEDGSGLLVGDTDCIITNNVFTNCSSALFWGISWEDINGTQVCFNNEFQNNNNTLFLCSYLPNNYTNQQLFFYNNLVNDTNYINPLCLTDDYSGPNLPFNSSIINLNITPKLGTRIYSDGRLIGGNFWAHPDGTGPSEVGVDADRDGFIDTPFDLFGNESIGEIYDYHPYSLDFDINTWVPITLPAEITQPGNYRIVSGWTSESDEVVTGLTISSSDVVVDGQNCSIETGSAMFPMMNFGVLINEGCSNVMLENINVTNSIFGIASLESSNFTVKYSTLNNNLIGFIAADSSDFNILNTEMGNCLVGFAAQIAHNFNLTDCNISNNSIYGMEIIYSDSFTIRNTIVNGTQMGSGIDVFDSSNFQIEGCTLNFNGIDGLTADTIANFTITGCTFQNNDWGAEMWQASNGTVQNCLMRYNNQSIYSDYLDNVNFTGNTFSYNGLVYGAYSGGFEASNSNCTVANNLFESNYDAIMWTATDEIAATQYIHDNIFNNNTYTFFFNNQLPSSCSNQKLYFYNNLVNDTAYVDPECFNSTYSGDYLPLNSTILNLNITMQSGARIYSNPSIIGGNFWAHPDGSGYSQTGTDTNQDGFVDTAFELFGNASIGMACDYLPYSSSYTTSLAYVSGASQSLVANQMSALIAVRLQDVYGALTDGVTFSLTSSSSTGKFYSDAAGTHQITSVTIPVGSSIGNFYYKDSTTGNPTLMAAAPDVTSATTQFTIAAHADTAEYITISANPTAITAGNSATFTATAHDQYGNSWEVTATYTVNGTQSATNIIAPVKAGNYIVQATYSDKVTSAYLTVSPAAVDHFTVQAPTSVTAGQSFYVTIQAIDAYGNDAVSFMGTVSLSSDQAEVTPSTSGTFSSEWRGLVTLVAGSGSVKITVDDGYGHTGVSNTITVESASSTPTPSPSPPPPTSTIQATTDSGSTVTLSISGNITSSQITGVTISTNQASSETIVSFTVSGQSGTTGFSNVTIPKTAVPSGTSPIVYIDGQPAGNQGYTEDDDNYYVWYTTSFSTHQVEIRFSGGNSSTQPPQTLSPWYIAVVIVAFAAVAFVLIMRGQKLKANKRKQP